MIPRLMGIAQGLAGCASSGPAGRARTRRPQEIVGIDPAVVAVAPDEVDGVPPHRLHLRDLDLPGLGHRTGQEGQGQAAGRTWPVPPVAADSTGAFRAQEVEAVRALVAVLPADTELAL